MGERSGIGWTDDTWNPWQGCRKVSPGCKFCYMYQQKRRYGQEPDVVVRSKSSTFNLPLRLKGPRVFTCSWSDFFITDADPWRDDAWDIIRRTPHLTYQILTKRPDRMARRLPWIDRPWPHVWLGASCEDQQRLEERLRPLCDTPAAVRFLSLEPLLGPLDLSKVAGIDWIIVGGESGAHHRDSQVGWFQSIADQCEALNVPLFIKQDSGAFPGQQGQLPAALWARKEFPDAAKTGIPT